MAENILFFDTETTGFPRHELPIDDDRQPNLVQLGLILHDGKNVVDMLNAIVKPDGWTIPKAASDVHGITTQIAMEKGIPLADAVDSYLAMRERADVLVAHNAEFDRWIIKRSVFMAGRRLTPKPNLRLECTKTMAEPVTKIEPTDRMKATGYGHKFKSPKLSECVSILLGEEMVGAHSAFIDCQYMARVYFKLKEMEAGNA